MLAGDRIIMIDENNNKFILDNTINKEKRRKALHARCDEYRKRILTRDPQEIAQFSAIRIERDENNKLFFFGEHYSESYKISWPELKVFKQDCLPVELDKEALWLHYIDRADGTPLTGRWVNLTEIGGLFYQQAFQGYAGDELSAEWEDNTEGLKQRCIEAGGWPISYHGDLTFEWRVLPRVPLCLCYRLPRDSDQAWATILFDASASHYIAADVAAIVGKELVERLKP
ncbi:MAG: DUF3786 domain-containing protein [Bacillota bacterium]|nr:DUF3786 domain-containing protein [Bacillota bacterium]